MTSQTADQQCDCSCADKCPLGRKGSQARCTASELRAAILQTQIPNDGRVYRQFVLLTGGGDKALDALNVAYTALNELTDGADIEAALRYLIARFSIQLPKQIIPYDR